MNNKDYLRSGTTKIELICRYLLRLLRKFSEARDENKKMNIYSKVLQYVLVNKKELLNTFDINPLLNYITIYQSRGITRFDKYYTLLEENNE